MRGAPSGKRTDESGGRIALEPNVADDTGDEHKVITMRVLENITSIIRGMSGDHDRGQVLRISRDKQVVAVVPDTTQNMKENNGRRERQIVGGSFWKGVRTRIETKRCAIITWCPLILDTVHFA